MRIVIIGGGMAGLTLAGHLQRRGIRPVVIEQSPEYGRVGFSIGLYPFSSGTLRETGVYQRFAQLSLTVQEYLMFDGHGRELQRMSMPAVLGRISGAMQELPRADLLDILASGLAGTDLRMGTRLTGLQQQGEEVTVTLSTGEEIPADLVVGTDGIHSQTRALLLGETPLEDWGFTAFTWWCPPSAPVGANILEYWGAAQFFGLYPVAGHVNAVGCLPTPPGLAQMDQEAMRAHVREAFAGQPGPVALALAALDGEHITPWRMADQRSPEWVVGRVALCGDAAAAFLPTAGVGASNAIKAAQVLADELGRADAASIPLALSLWEQRVRPRVEANQEDSRHLARLAFARSHGVADVRDLLLRHYPVEKIARNVLKSNVTPF